MPYFVVTVVESSVKRYVFKAEEEFELDNLNNEFPVYARDYIENEPVQTVVDIERVKRKNLPIDIELDHDLVNEA